MFHLTQYIVVRRDLPLEDILPQACHAAGKAMFCYCAKLAYMGNAEANWVTLNRDWGHPTRIIRGSKNEGRLRKLAGILASHSIEHVTITEPDEGPLKGQMTALALFPGEKEMLGPLLNDFQNLRWADVPAFPKTPT
jgi:hypothetical protein